MKIITVKEYDCLVRQNKHPAPANENCREIESKTFDHLQTLYAGEPKIRKVLTPTITKEGRAGLKINRYTGVLQTPDGTQLEILPKITAAGEDVEQARRILIRMLRFLGPYRALETSRQAAVRMERMPLWEIFISLFLEAASQLIRRGLRFAYVRHRGNQTYCRGKLLIDRQIQHNFTHPERFFVEYDHFSPNRPANRLIRSALDAARRLTTAPNNQRRLSELSFALDDVPPSSDHRSDFQLVRLDREMGYYPPVLNWCRIILGGYNPLTAAGSRPAISLLFPMPELFESYVTACLTRNISPKYYLTAQAQNQHLTTHKGDSHFKLRPDLLIREVSNDRPISVMDTKWKLLNNTPTYGLQQGDLYQMFAYGHKYLNGAGDMALIYPKTPEFTEPLAPFHFSERLRLHVLPFDLNEERPILPALPHFADLFGLPKAA